MKLHLITIAHALSLFLVLTLNPAFGADITGSSAPLNPEFVSHQSSRAAGVFNARSVTYPTGYAPSPIDYSYLKNLPATSGRMQSMAAALPVSYDLRSLNRVTPVKDQNPGNTCWAFASMASVESNVLSLFSETRNFSENNLKNTSGFDYGFNGGGNTDMATAYFARWSGPVNTADDPYNPSSGISPPGLTVQKHLQEALIIPPGDTSSLKQSIMQYGATVVSLYVDVNSFYNEQTHAYYYSGNVSSNHMVAVVGWDDNFLGANFLNAPPGNGAFIAKNSWGTWWGDNGYFYISYYDAVLNNKPASVFNGTESATNYGRVYQYDPLGKTASFGYSSPAAWFANVFTAQGNESLTAVSFHTATPATSYQVRIYRDVSNSPVTGQPVATKSGSIPLPGYHTIKLDSPVSLSAGHTFSIVVYVNAPGYTYPVSMEQPVAGYSSQATASPGQSFVTWDSGGNPGTWSDLTVTHPNSNICLKGFTLSTLTLTVTGQVSSGGGTISCNSPVVAGVTTTCTISPTSGWHVSTIGGTCPQGSYNPALPTNNYTTGLITADCTVAPTFVSGLPDLTNLSITGPASVNESSAANYTATATWSDGSTTAVTPTWSVTPATYAGINSSTGVLTTLAVPSNQTVTVGASYTAGGVTKTAGKTVTIIDAANQPFFIFIPNEPGIQGVLRSDNGNDATNLDTASGKPTQALSWYFLPLLKDPGGLAPQYVRLYLAQRAKPVAADFQAYDLFKVAGDLTTAAAYLYPTKLGPAAAVQFHYEAKLADGAVLRLPAAGELTGPSIQMLTGINFVGIPRDTRNTSLSAQDAFGSTVAYRFSGGAWSPVSSGLPVSPGEGYLILRQTATGALPALDSYPDVTDQTFPLPLTAGLNVISNPYPKNVRLFDVKVQKGSQTPVTMIDAITNGWIANGLFSFNGQDWGGGFTIDSFGAADPTLVPWIGYLLVLNKNDDTYKLVISKP